MSFTADDHERMARALQLAERGLWTTSPNPRVGCVLVKNGQIVGEGWHEKAGEPHAEVFALRAAGEAARGATAYVTLEPCSHHGRTPPCAGALIQAGVAKVIAAMQDPNPLVAGRGLALLQAAGIETASGLLESQALALNPGFISRMTRQRPWVRIKSAGSLDGRTALANGQSQWITGPEARVDGHRWRAQACAILTGIGTVLADDPQLNVRVDGMTRQPDRIVLDSHLRTPPSAKLLHSPGGKVLIVCTEPHLSRAHTLQAAGAEVIGLPANATGQIDLNALMAELTRRGYNEVHVEAGAHLNGALLAAGLVDEAVLYLAPRLLGNPARGLFELPDYPTLQETLALTIADIRQVGHDIRLTLKPQ